MVVYLVVEVAQDGVRVGNRLDVLLLERLELLLCGAVVLFEHSEGLGEQELGGLSEVSEIHVTHGEIDHASGGGGGVGSFEALGESEGGRPREGGLAVLSLRMGWGGGV